MKFYKVVVPVGYDVFKVIKANSAKKALAIGLADLETNFDSWHSDGDEPWIRFGLGVARRISVDDEGDDD